MARRSVRDKFRKGLGAKTTDSQKRTGGGSDFKDYFDNSKMDGVQKWWAGKGDHIIDIIPYEVGDKDPLYNKGDVNFVLEVSIHREVGPMNDVVICLYDTYGKPCPICEERMRLSKQNADYETVIKPLKPSKRCMYNVIVRDSGEQEKKGVQIFEIAWWFMGRHLGKISKDKRTGGVTIYSDPDEGKSISFERTGTGSGNTGYDGHSFSDRPEPITDEELDQAYCLDDLIEVRTYEEIYELFHAVKSTPPDDKGDEEEQEEQEETQEEPSRKTGGKKGGKKKRKEREIPECPAGGTIGEDIDEYDECDGCEHYDVCEEIAENS